MVLQAAQPCVPSGLMVGGGAEKQGLTYQNTWKQHRYCLCQTKIYRKLDRKCLSTSLMRKLRDKINLSDGLNPI